MHVRISASFMTGYSILRHYMPVQFGCQEDRAAVTVQPVYPACGRANVNQKPEISGV
jgi:hypothetical protein